MQICEECNNKITYGNLFFVVRCVKCSQCNTKYKVNIRSYLVLLLMLGAAVFALNFSIATLTGASKIVSISLIFLCLFILAPFNQKLVKVQLTSNSTRTKNSWLLLLRRLF